MYCDFCTCSDCKTGDCKTFDQDGNETNYKPTLPHTQCEDGRWICSTCYYYECCLDAGSHDPCSGDCGNHTCEHRPELVNDEWTFWIYHLGNK